MKSKNLPGTKMREIFDSILTLTYDNLEVKLNRKRK